MARLLISVEERFWLKVQKGDDCWLWIAHTDEKGYGTFRDGKMHKAHRWSYRKYVGEIPAGLEVDHRCFVANCVRPDHLRAVTGKHNCENRPPVGRGVSKYRGVTHHPQTGSWMARYSLQGKRIYLGLYETEELAYKAVSAARLANHTHNDAEREWNG